MEQTLLVEIDRCWGCKACQVACKQAHQTPPGPGGVEVQAVEGPGAEPSCDYIPVMCQQRRLVCQGVPAWSDQARRGRGTTDR